ncbi:MOSC domain-containing protein [Hasllibacter halocynthiae]|uniref:MOSC domain-containing protein n=1 Tax=Hasllibacter halocynthiae TaxID=595589 RepID=A0A2T0X8K4_9RHOB|nr:MOSC domain-containing protein [Hasllibacter halocynthiae]PRY95259.1 MOSC domain-containing protein [Hasllibacter halocynthiae]
MTRRVWTLAELTSAFPRAGRVEAILLRPERRAEPIRADAATLREDGLEGDHARPGKRAVTLIQAEHLPVISALAGREATPEALRRNLVVAGLNLAACRGRRLRVGGSVVTITGPCAPCSRMEEALGEGGYNAVRGHGGWYAEVDAPGRIAVGDAVLPG